MAWKLTWLITDTSILQLMELTSTSNIHWLQLPWVLLELGFLENWHTSQPALRLTLTAGVLETCQSVSPICFQKQVRLRPCGVRNPRPLIHWLQQDHVQRLLVSVFKAEEVFRRNQSGPSFPAHCQGSCR